MNTPEDLGAALFIEPLRWLLLNYVLVLKKKINIKKVQKEIAFALISLKHLHYKSLQADQPLESIGLCSKIC